MIGRLLLAALLTFSKFLIAADPNVKITAFHYAGSNTRAAELCGRLTGTWSGLVGVKVVVDGNSSRPTNYYTLVGHDGDFCVTIVTYNGVADAYPWRAGERESGSLPATRANVIPMP
jgi:hypothetical protein